MFAKDLIRKSIAAMACLLSVLWVRPAMASPIVITITGVTGEIQIGEGPIFGHHSYQTVPGGAPFELIYTFEEKNGKQSIANVQGDLITESKIENETTSSPGTSAFLRIDGISWEFGRATRSAVTFTTKDGSKSEQITYMQAGSNKVSAQIVPGKGAYWPRNGDWRASFSSSSLEGSTASFSADNDRVSAKGSLIPETITVSGVDLDGQWLRAGDGPESGARSWKLAHASPAGGYLVEEVRRTLLGSAPDGSAISPTFVRYWQAWQLPPGGAAPPEAEESLRRPAPAGSKGEDQVTITARFYEGVTLPSSFASGRSPWAGATLSSVTNPDLPTTFATLPVSATFTLHF